MALSWPPMVALPLPGRAPPCDARCIRLVQYTSYLLKSPPSLRRERERAQTSVRKREDGEGDMALQAALKPAATAAPKASATPLSPPPGAQLGLRRPPDRHALRSSFSPSVHLLLSPLRGGTPPSAATAPKFSMRVTSKQAYICRDCGYIYNDRAPFEKLPDKYFCPVCGAPKRRFRVYEPAVAKNDNDTDVRKARKAQLKRDAAIGNALPFAVAIGVAALAGLYFYLNSTY